MSCYFHGLTRTAPTQQMKSDSFGDDFTSQLCHKFLKIMCFFTSETEDEVDVQSDFAFPS